MWEPGKGEPIVPVSSRPAEVVAEAEVAGKSEKANSASGSRGTVTPVVVGSTGLEVMSQCSEFLTSTSIVLPYSAVSFLIPREEKHTKKSLSRLQCVEKY